MNPLRLLSASLLSAVVQLSNFATFAGDFGLPWKRHTIDDSSVGADGVRLADANGDGLPDITTGWEEGGVLRVYLYPGPSRTKDKWPAMTVGKVGSVEAAVFVDLDVLTCEESKNLGVFWYENPVKSRP